MVNETSLFLFVAVFRPIVNMLFTMVCRVGGFVLLITLIAICFQATSGFC